MVVPLSILLCNMVELPAKVSCSEQEPIVSGCVGKFDLVNWGFTALVLVFEYR